MLNTMAFSKKYTPMNLLLLFVIHFADSVIQNITGGLYLQNRYVDTNVIRAIKDIGPKMCVEDCMFYSGCDAVNYRPSQLTCELLNGSYPYNQTAYRSGVYFTKLEGWTREANQCWPNPCKGRTKCVPAYNNHHVCTTFDTPCDIAPCQNDGTCRNEVDSYRCVCPSGYYGSVCEYTPCSGISCYNGGTCQISGSTWYCQCPSGYQGSRCQNDPCSYSDCDGTCTVVGSQWKCCTDGFWRSSATCVYGYG